MTGKRKIVCPQCNAVNAVPTNKDVSTAKCGQCKSKLLPGTPINADTVSFQKMISRNELPVVVDFWAPWCGPCRMMGPQFEQAAAQLQSEVIFLKLNTEDEQQIAAQYGIRGIPTMALFKNGKELSRTSGAMQAGQIVQWIRPQL